MESLPFDINGCQKFVLPCDPANLMKSSKDRRPWKTWCTSLRSGFKGIRRRAQCGGSWVCPNSNCLFRNEMKSPNTVQFVGRKNEKQCFVCETKATFVPCKAIKVWEFTECKTSVTVYHQGNHTCTPVPKRNCAQVEGDLKKAFSKNRTITPSQAASNTLVEALRDESDWQKIDAVAVTLADSKGIEAIKKKSRKDDLGHSFEELAEFKKFCDKRDPFYVYRISDERHHNELSFVFKVAP